MIHMQKWLGIGTGMERTLSYTEEKNYVQISLNFDKIGNNQ